MFSMRAPRGWPGKQTRKYGGLPLKPVAFWEKILPGACLNFGHCYIRKGAGILKSNEGQVKYDGSSFRRIVDRKINDARTPDKTTSSLRPEEFFGAGPSIRLRKAHSANSASSSRGNGRSGLGFTSSHPRAAKFSS